MMLDGTRSSENKLQTSSTVLQRVTVKLQASSNRCSTNKIQVTVYFTRRGERVRKVNLFLKASNLDFSEAATITI